MNYTQNGGNAIASAPSSSSASGKKGIWPAVIAAAGTIGGTLLSGLFGNKSDNKNADLQRELNREQLGYNKWALNQQREWALKDYARERADYINDAYMSAVRSRASLLNSGYNTAFGTESGINVAQPLGGQINDVSALAYNPNMTLPYHNNFGGLGEVLSPLSYVLQMEQLKNIESNTNKTKAETKNIETNTEKIQAEFDNWKQNVPILNKTLEEQLNTIIADKEVKQATKEKVINEAQEVLARIDSITFDVQQMKPQQLKNLKKEWFLLAEQIKTQAFERKSLAASAVASYSIASLNKEKENGERILNGFRANGIGVGSGLIEQIVAMLGTKEGSSLVPAAIDNITKLITDITKYFTDDNEGKNSGPLEINGFKFDKDDFTSLSELIDLMEDTSKRQRMNDVLENFYKAYNMEK